jgi:hypothetical protein
MNTWHNSAKQIEGLAWYASAEKQVHEIMATQKKQQAVDQARDGRAKETLNQDTERAKR